MIRTLIRILKLRSYTDSPSEILPIARLISLNWATRYKNSFQWRIRERYASREKETRLLFAANVRDGCAVKRLSIPFAQTSGARCAWKLQVDIDLRAITLSSLYTRATVHACTCVHVRRPRHAALRLFTSITSRERLARNASFWKCSPLAEYFKQSSLSPPPPSPTPVP